MGTASVESMFQRLNLSEKSAVSLDHVEEDYVLDIASQSGDGKYMAATSSNFTARLFSKNNLAGVGVVKGHTDVLSGICWGKSDYNLLYTSSKDKSIRCWDTRMKLTKEVQKFEGSDESENIFTCVDINAEDNLLCAGQEKDKDENAFIMFWDRRNKEIMGAYSESHQDDITQVNFHATKSQSLASGSTDGLVCLFDLAETCEDDALSYTFNSCSTVAKIGWLGDKLDRIYCTTHMDTVHIWDTTEGDVILEKTDLKSTFKGNDAIEYVVDFMAGDNDIFHLLCGNHSGDIKVVELSADKTPSVTCTLSGGHTSTVRCLHWNKQDNSMVTGAEDSLLCLWTATSSKAETPAAVGTKKAKLKTKKPISKRKNPY